MKKLLFILFPVFSYGQITILKATNTAGSTACGTVGVANIVHNNLTFNVGKVYICIVVADSTNSYGSNVQLTSFTWDTVVQFGNFSKRTAVYRCTATSTTTTDDPKVEFSAPNYPSGMSFQIFEIGGVVTTNNGEDAIAQVVIDSANSANPSIIMAALTSRAGVLFSVAANVYPPTGTPESDWTESLDGGCTVAGQAYPLGHYIMYRVATSDNTPTVTMASIAWMGVAIEFIEAPYCGGAAMTVIKLGQGYSSAGIGVVAGATFVPGRLYIFFVGISNDAGTPATVTLTGTSQTWDEITSTGGVANGGNRKRIQAFRYAPTTTHSNQTDFNITGGQDGMWQNLFEITGADVTGTNGANAIIQNALSSANSADPTLTFGANVSSPRNLVMMGVINGVNPFTGSPEAGFTEDSDNGYGTPDTGAYTMYDIGSIDKTPTVTMTSGNWAAIALEIRARCRRTNTN